MGPLPISSPVLVTNVVTNNYYLAFTENTNLTTTPIKFAPPPFVPPVTTPTNVLTDGFEQIPAGDHAAVQTFGNGWTVTNNQVSVVSDPANAYEGSNYLALASGTIFTNLPTVAGNTYTLTFAYRGPEIAGWWRGENNVNDAIYGNNGTVQNAGFTNGIVGRAFSNDPENYSYGTYNGFDVPDQPAYQLTNSLSIEGWVRPRGDGYVIFWRGDNRPGYDPYSLSMQGNNTLSFYIEDAANNYTHVDTTLTYGDWHHVAATLDGNSGNLSLYIDGALASQINTPLRPFGALNPGLSPGIGIANVNDGQNNFPFTGDIDEISLYSRNLSASEIKAIYNAGDAGKFDPVIFSTSPAQSLAEAQVSLDGQTQGTLYGNNTNWQVETITFTATQNGTPLSITGLEPGMLLDDFVLTAVPGNLYYQPEQSLGAFTGKSAYGDWQLEIQDDRVGAGLTNLLVSWELQFVFANTNAIPAVLSGGIGQSSQFIPAGDIAWYQISVPASANYATNILKFASAPVNVWFSANVPPTITNPGDVDLIPNSTGRSALLSTNGSPVNTTSAYIVPGGTYYLGVQNTNVSTVKYGIEVDFDRGNAPGSGLPALVINSVKASGSGTTMNWTASATAQFQMQWTDDLAQPWNTDTNVITSGDGNFNFTDDGLQTAPLGTQRFYRLVQISP